MFGFALGVRNKPCPPCECKPRKQAWVFHLPGAQGIPRWLLPPSCPTSCTGSQLTSHWGPIWLLVWVRACAQRPCRQSWQKEGCAKWVSSNSWAHSPHATLQEVSDLPLCPWGATSLIIPPLVPWGRVGEHRIIVTDHVLEREPRRPEAGGKQAMKTALCLQPPYTGLVFLLYDNWVKH